VTEEEEEEEDIPHIDALTSWVVCIDNKFHDLTERNVTIRSEI
jgi:hypothetical protein